MAQRHLHPGRRELGEHPLVAAQLFGGEGVVGLVGHRTVGEHRGQPQLGTGEHGSGQTHHLVGLGAHPVHAGVDLEVHLHRVPRTVGGHRGRQLLDTGGGVHGGVEVVAHQVVELVGRGLAQHDDRTVQSGLSQLGALGRQGHGQAVGAAGQRGPGHLHSTVAVALGLHHGADAAGGHQVAQDADVVGDGSQIDVGPGGAHRVGQPSPSASR